MSDVIAQVLWLAVMLQLKHTVADFVLQNRYILDNRRRYGHPGGLLHVLLHLIGSAIAFLIVGVEAKSLIYILLIEAVFHYHLDWIKDGYVHRKALKPTDYAYWFAIGADQLLHQLSYIGLIWLWVLWHLS